uniref:Uncharacterized protein LOC104249970 n=1 Tax=Nicotiana sylvestris TaxID=4096 RepID=A0A1U7Z1N4_NICSY|nr:PREDICTED: uncharacterized protein LOC104249970 [Nicotiana sylvestris]
MNLQTDVTTALQHLKPNYKIAPAIIINRVSVNPTINFWQLQWEGNAGYINIDGTDFAMEAHMVHQSADGKIAVVAIPLFRDGKIVRKERINQRKMASLKAEKQVGTQPSAPAKKSSAKAHKRRSL